MRKVLIFAFMLLPTFRLVAQSTIFKFDVLLNNEVIGSLTATKSVSGKKVVKNISNNTNTKILLLSVHVESEIYATCENDILIGSFAYRHVNRGAENIETTVKLIDGNRYKVNRNGVSQIIDSEVIKYSVVDLYFKEPKGLTSIFSNTHGAFIRIVNLSPGKYEIVLPEGKTNVFTYSNGKLIKVEAPIAIGSVVFRRKAGA